MAINHAAQTSTVQCFLLTSERFLLLSAPSGQSTKQSKRCVLLLRTCVPHEFASEWVDPVQYRIDRHVSAGLSSIHQGSMS